MKVISAAQWVADSQYLPVAQINQPIRDFSRQFHTATAFMKDGTSGLLFSGKGGPFILRELADNNQTEILVPVKAAATENAPRAGKVEDSLINAMRDLGLRLPRVASLLNGLDRDRLEVVMGFGLHAGSFDSRPLVP
ncbi:MAG TPA: hypothetical protein VFS88_02695 [Micavibrio sp.]|nr:hypothetical protein [Micavibrio sp.]